jgi:hypothetical protein
MGFKLALKLGFVALCLQALPVQAIEGWGGLSQNLQNIAATPEPVCEHELALRKGISGIAKAVTFEVLDPAPYMKAFNAIPPVGDYPTPQRLIAAHAPSKKTVLIFGFNHDCMVISGHITNEAHAKILSQLGLEI